MSEIYGDEPIKYLEQTPQRMREEIERLQGLLEVATDCLVKISRHPTYCSARPEAVDALAKIKEISG